MIFGRRCCFISDTPLKPAKVKPIKTEATPTLIFLIAKRCFFGSNLCINNLLLLRDNKTKNRPPQLFKCTKRM